MNSENRVTIKWVKLFHRNIIRNKTQDIGNPSQINYTVLNMTNAASSVSTKEFLE